MKLKILLALSLLFLSGAIYAVKNPGFEKLTYQKSSYLKSIKQNM